MRDEVFVDAELAAVGMAAEKQRKSQFSGGENLGWIVGDCKRKPAGDGCFFANCGKNVFGITRADDAEIGADITVFVDQPLNGDICASFGCVREIDGIVISENAEGSEFCGPGGGESFEGLQCGVFIAAAVHDVAGEENEVCGGSTQCEHGFAELRGDGAAAADVEISEVEDAETVELRGDFGMG